MKLIHALPLAMLVAVALLHRGSITPSLAQTPGGTDAYVAEWDAIAVQAITAAGLTAPEGHVALAPVAIVVYDAVVAIKGGFEPFAVKMQAPSGASAEAAVAAAAYRALSRLFPAQEPSILGPAYAKSLSSIPDGTSKADGIAVGRGVTDKFFALRASFGSGPLTYTPPSPVVAGAWLPTAAGAIAPGLHNMKPFSLVSSNQFRPAGPPALTSDEWAREYNEIKAIGSRTSTTRTAEQTLAARFWGEAPVPQARASFQSFIRDHQLNVVDAARFMAMISVAYADSLLACFDAKYHYAFWRPVTAIAAGGTDGNAATEADPSWLPLLPATPNHPEYPSAHSCITPAGAMVVARFLGTDQINFTVPSVSGLGDRFFARVSDLNKEVGEARIWGGIHFRSAIEDGTEIARKTVEYVMARHFRPTSAVVPAAAPSNTVPAVASAISPPRTGSGGLLVAP